jgi:hypothetical protein
MHRVKGLYLKSKTLSTVPAAILMQRIIPVTILLFLPAAQRANAGRGIAPDLGLIQAPEATQAEALLHQIYDRGQQALEANRLADAERAFRQVLAMDPQNAGAYVNLGVIAYTPEKSFADLKDLAKLPPTTLKISWQNDSKGEDGITNVSVQNPSNHLAFFIHLSVLKGSRGDEILPVRWEDNYFSLLPGEKRVSVWCWPSRRMRS